MHFVDPVYDRGPEFFAFPVPIEPGEYTDSLAANVNRAEHDGNRGSQLCSDGQVRLAGKEVVYTKH